MLQNHFFRHSSKAGEIFAGTMYLIEGQFSIWWPNFGSQKVWQMPTKDTAVDIVQPKFLRIFRIYGNALKNPLEN